MLEYSLKLIGNIISINEQHIPILNKLELICKEIKNNFNLTGITYFSYKNSIKHELSIPENIKVYNISEKVFTIGIPEKKNLKDLFVLNIPVKDSFYIYGAMQLLSNKQLTFEQEKLLNLISYQIGAFINHHRINESINERLKNIHNKKEIIEHFNEKFFRTHLLLLSKLLSSESIIDILRCFSVYICYNDFFNINKGIYYIKDKSQNSFKPMFSYEIKEQQFLTFNEALININKLKVNRKFLNKLPVGVNREDLLEYFNSSFIYSIEFNGKISGFFITEKKDNKIKIALNLLALSIEYFEKSLNIKKLHNKIKEVENKLFQSNVSKNYAEIINQISHEIKNPLIAIAGFSKRLVKYLDEKPEPDYNYLKDRIKIILDESLRLENLLHDLIIFNRAEKPEKKKFSLYSIIKKTINLFKALLEEKNIKIKFEYKKTPFISGDPLQIRQLLYNLILNSYEAIKSKGDITIRLYPGEKNAILEIEDNGGGISEKIIQNIFNPFFTTKVKGSGLGLAIVYKIVKNHNGEIFVKNQKGGVKFTIKLPFGGKNEKKDFINR